MKNLSYTIINLNLKIIKDNSSPSIRVLQKTNLRYQCPLGDCISENNNIYVGLTSATQSRFSMHLSDTSSIAQHLKKTVMPHNWISENSYRKHNDIRITK